MKNYSATKFFEKSQDDVWTVSKSDWNKELFRSCETFNKQPKSFFRRALLINRKIIKERTCTSPTTENQEKLWRIEV